MNDLEKQKILITAEMESKPEAVLVQLLGAAAFQTTIMKRTRFLDVPIPSLHPNLPATDSLTIFAYIEFLGQGRGGVESLNPQVVT